MKSKFAGMNVSVDKPARLVLIHPRTRQPLRDAQGKEAYIELYSNESEVARQHNMEVQRRRLRAARGRIRIEPEEVEADAVELYARLTAAWHLINLDGTVLDVPCNVENAREFYAAAPLAWVRTQVDDFVTDMGNFSLPSSTT